MATPVALNLGGPGHLCLAPQPGPAPAVAPLGERMEKIVDAVIAGRDPKAVAGDWKLEIDPGLAKPSSTPPRALPLCSCWRRDRAARTA